MTPKDILPSSFLDNLGTDWIAVDRHGSVICRAATREAVERAVAHTGAGDAVAFFSGADLAAQAAIEGRAPSDQGSTADLIGADIAALEEIIAGEAPPPVDNEHVEKGATAFSLEEITLNVPRVSGAEAFDHDGDGRVGGSEPKKSRKRKPSK